MKFFYKLATLFTLTYAGELWAKPGAGRFFAGLGIGVVGMFFMDAYAKRCRD